MVIAGSLVRRLAVVEPSCLPLAERRLDRLNELQAEGAAARLQQMGRTSTLLQRYREGDVGIMTVPRGGSSGYRFH